jgi:hypothetical protein
MALTIAQRKRLHAALLDAYPASGELALMLGLLNGRVYYDFTAPATRRVEYFNLIVQINAQGWIADFVAGAAEDRPDHAGLQALAGELAAGPTPRAFTDNDDESKQSALQRIVREGQPDDDAAHLMDAIARASAAVCVIDWNEQPQGTGFLVGPDLVLTNWHVANPLEGRVLAGLSVRFGFRRDLDGAVASGVRYGFAADWLVRSRAYDSTDESLDPDDVPDPLALDYALIRLASAPAGTVPLMLDPATPLPATGTDLVMIQHPSGAPQKISFGRVTAHAGAGRRLRYDVNTKPGSSGSPILNHRGELVGLHHAGDPNFAQLAQYNQGIPIALIAADIAAGGG